MTDLLTKGKSGRGRAGPPDDPSVGKGGSDIEREARMSANAYSFIDISVLDEVRTHFAAGDPLILLTTDLTTVLWANGPGAAFLGHNNVEAAMGASAPVDAIARRQIASLPGYPRIGRDRKLLIRHRTGLGNGTLSCRASSVRLADGGTGILLAIAAALPDGRGVGDLAMRAIGGIGNEGRFAALVDRDGRILAETSGFAGLGVDPQTIHKLIGEVRTERDRLVKRMIPAASGDVAAGMARLTDDPALHLLVIVDDRAESDPGETAAPAEAVISGETAGKPYRPALPEETDRPVKAGPAGPPGEESSPFRFS